MVDVLSRRTKRLNRARVQLELSRAAKPVVWVLLGVGLGIGLLAFILQRTTPDAFTGTYTARIAVQDATAVQPGLNDVRFKGIPVGTVTRVGFDGDQTVLDLRIRRKYGQLYRDARAQLRPNTALQDMYVDVVDRGTPAGGALRGSEPLDVSRTQMPVNIADVLNTFGPSQRLRLRTLLDQLGNGLEDRGTSLRSIFVTLAPFIRNAGEVTRQVAERGPQVQRLVHNASVLTAALGERQEALTTLVRQGGSTLTALQQGSPDLDRTLVELPPTLRAVTTSFRTTQAALGDVDGALRALKPIAGKLPTSLKTVRALSGDLEPPLAALQTPVRRLVPLTDRLQPLSRDLRDAVGVLAPQVDTVDKVTKTLVACEDGVVGFFQWNASMSKFGDVRGPFPRGNVVVGAQSSSVLNDPNEYAPESCAPGRPIGGRVPTAKDMG